MSLKPAKHTKAPKIEFPRVSDIKNLKDEGMCLSMWQPWASLLVYGIKRLEGRSWFSEHRGRLWIHAGSKPVESNLVEEIEQEYAHLKDSIPFPESYPTSALLGYIDVIGCPSNEELKTMKEHYKNMVEKDDEIEYWIHEDNESAYAFVCVNPKKLLLPFHMSGEHKICMLSDFIDYYVKLTLSSSQIA